MSPEQRELLARREELQSQGVRNYNAVIAEEMGISRHAVEKRISRALSVKGREPTAENAAKSLEAYGYTASVAERTPAEAWASHRDTFERELGKSVKRDWPTIKRGRGPYVLAHFTDEHVDDNSSALHLLEADIKAAKDLGAVIVHGGDALNNWPMAGKLAQQWAYQECSLPDGLLRLQHMIEIMNPDVWVDGNHEKMNPYLVQLIDQWLPKKVIRGDWRANFEVQSEGGRTLRAAVSHKFGKGQSWFHKTHAHIREMLEGEPVDLLMDGHVHSYGEHNVMLPERGQTTLCVASSGYKLMDKYAERISRGGVVPKIYGRCAFIVVDDSADETEAFCKAWPSARQAEANLNGLQNLRAA